MSRRLALGCLCVWFSAVGSGCVLVEKRTRSLARPSCHPSQYWDGNQCRHKGKGNGARKHDGAAKPGKRR